VWYFLDCGKELGKRGRDDIMTEIARTGNHALQLFNSELLKDEKLLWSGQPELKVFTVSDFFLIPFSLFFFCFSVFWILGASGVSTGSHNFGLFGLFGLPFVLVGAYMLFGRFFFKFWKQKNTYYAVTNQRILVLSTVPGRSVQAVFIESMPTLNKFVNADGTGTITFGDLSPQLAMYANTGMDGFATGSGMPLPPALYNIKNANSVYELINSQRKK
jgi:hypothetical protein